MATIDKVEHARRRQQELVELAYPARSEVALECDLVMKGGITSGVVYPLAVCELARHYRFRNLGGSSAGAIAAVMVAAAEYGRDTGGYNRIAQLPEDIGDTLGSLFKSGPHTTEAHGLLMAFLEPGRRNKVRRFFTDVAGGRIRYFLVGALVLLVLMSLPLLATAGFPSDGGDWVQLLVGFVLLLPLAFLAGVLVATAVVAVSTKRGLNKQGFGLCVGSDGLSASDPTPDNPGNLTDWLAHMVDHVAGVDRPLTFGDLWGDGPERMINLEVMTTNLGHGRPMSFPFGEHEFLYDPSEWSTYFPPAVVAAMNHASRPAVDPVSQQPLLSDDGHELRHFPDAKDVPIVVAARLSLSFPALISAVPLHAVDRSRSEEKDRVPVRLWFSDGGITSNFPIHFFDSLWPRRPTFALDLRGYHPDRPNDDVYWPGPAPHGKQPRVNRITDVVAFGKSILDTMQYWADDAQATLPGYRDRVVEVHLTDVEGGMNLRMPADVIAVLAEKGRQAAEKLELFDFDQHRWTRYLTAMSELQDTVGRMSKLFDDRLPCDLPPYVELVERAPRSSLYQRPTEWVEPAAARTRRLLAFASDTAPDFAEDAPRPDPVLRITPKF